LIVATEDETNVDRRRAEIGLPSLAEYLAMVKAALSAMPPK
jgi:hypothetical protein